MRWLHVQTSVLAHERTTCIGICICSLRRFLSSCRVSSVMSVRLTGEEWERHKSFIQALYIDEHRKLQGPGGVMQELMTRFGFRAT
jgi:hypothetical protein